MCYKFTSQHTGCWRSELGSLCMQVWRDYSNAPSPQPLANVFKKTSKPFLFTYLFKYRRRSRSYSWVFRSSHPSANWICRPCLEYRRSASGSSRHTHQENQADCFASAWELVSVHLWPSLGLYSLHWSSFKVEKDASSACLIELHRWGSQGWTRWQDFPCVPKAVFHYLDLPQWIAPVLFVTFCSKLLWLFLKIFIIFRRWISTPTETHNSGKLAMNRFTCTKMECVVLSPGILTNLVGAA